MILTFMIRTEIRSIFDCFISFGDHLYQTNPKGYLKGFRLVADLAIHKLRFTITYKEVKK